MTWKQQTTFPTDVLSNKYFNNFQIFLLKALLESFHWKAFPHWNAQIIPLGY